MRLTPDGRCLAADDAALALLGYTLDEIKALPPHAIWRDDDDGDGSEAERLDTLCASNGDRIAVQVVSSDPADGSVLVTFRLIGGRRIAIDRRGAPKLILDQWRRLERRLASMDEGDSEAVVVRRDIDDLRALYQRTSQREGTPEAAMADAGMMPPPSDRDDGLLAG